MPGPYLVDFSSGSDKGPSPYEVEQARIRPRYVQLLIGKAGFDTITAELAIATLFDHPRQDGTRCICSCHPHFSSTHEDGFDCSCSWDDERRAESKAWFEEWRDSPAAKELRDAVEAERIAVAQWVAGDPGVTAEQTTWAALEQWEGTVDGHSFYFRERHELWSLEIDLEPTGRFANRIVGTNDEGELEREPESINEGRTIAEGSAAQLPDGAVGHIEFIVRTIRDHLFAESCDHAGALFYCPTCGTRMAEPNRAISSR